MKSRKSLQSNHRERGVALVVVMIFMLALTILAALGVRTASTGEKVARNQLDHQVARQAAEAALRDAERDLKLTTGNPMSGALCERGAARPVMEEGGVLYFNETCKAGQCSLPIAAYESANYASAPAAGVTSEPWWPVARGGLWNNAFNAKPSRELGAINCTTFTGGVPLGTYTGAPPIAGVSRQPEYLIEVFQRGTDTYFRITSRGFGYDPATQVVLQSYFRPFL